MSFQLSAPYPQLETVTFLPNPEFSDIRRPVQNVAIRRSMNNTTRTYVKTSSRKVFNYTFSLTRQKALELRAFIESYYSSQLQIIDHDSRRWIVYFTGNPFEINGAGAALNYPGSEYATIPLAFEGEEG